MDIQDLRNEINGIDEELLRLFCRRMETAGEIAKIKQRDRLPVWDPAREREILGKIGDKTDEALSGYARVLWQTLFDVSRSYQRQLLSSESDLMRTVSRVAAETPVLRVQRAVVACQGVEGAYSQHAAEKMFKYPSILYFARFEDVFKAVDGGLCRYGVLPIENSAAGSVNEVYDLLRKYHFYITHSSRLCISHTLLAPKGAKLDGIKEVYSHAQAIRQCAEFLKQSGVKIHECQNTAKAAQLVAESGRTDVAAIGSKDCAALYNLQILSSDIQNTQNNYTRFICISKEPEIYPGAKKSSILLRLDHKPGALYHAIARFAALGLNLTKLESRPIPGTDFEFLFYFDVEVSVLAPEFKTLIAALENEGDSFIYLGTYTED